MSAKGVMSSIESVMPKGLPRLSRLATIAEADSKKAVGPIVGPGEAIPKVVIEMKLEGTNTSVTPFDRDKIFEGFRKPTPTEKPKIAEIGGVQ